jgi:ACR3 family arsenite efflux pump ArsB
MQDTRDALEQRQIPIYFAAVALAAAAAWALPGTALLERAINPALALMLYVTFLQVPVAELRRAFGQLRFLAALMAANFIVVPVLVWALLPFLPADPLLRLGALLVLLAATPALLIAQMLALPGYLGLFLGDDAARLVQARPFVHAFVWLIAVPLALAAATQLWAARSPRGASASAWLGLLPVPATALVLFVVIASVLPQLGPATHAAWSVVPVYAAFAVAAPALGWLVARAFRLPAPAGRAVAFSAGTRNSLVVLPLALAVPGALPVLPAVIVTQTLVELLAELAYVRVIALWGRGHQPAGQ